MIIRFDQETPVELAGRKGHRLSRMWRAGLPIPAGFCVPWDDIGKIRVSELDRALADLTRAAGGTTFAVRSSSICEDAIDASFAGMLLSRLNLTSECVLAALEEIRDSASAPVTVAYSKRLNVPAPAHTAAIVQVFLPAEASGVLFTRDPQTVAGRFVVEASWGLGPGVVDGLVRPDRWLIGADGTVISSEVADKDIAIVPDPSGGTAQVPVDPSCRRRPCMRPESLRELLSVAARCERLFGGPQDIEWALWENQVWLLQSRPITA